MTARRAGRFLGWTLVVLAALALVAIGFARSTRALEWAAAQLSASAARTGATLEFEQLSGSLFTSIRAQHIDYAQGGTRARLAEVEIDPKLAALWRRELVFNRIAIARAEVDSTPSGDPLLEPESLALPIEVRVDRASVGSLVLRRGDSRSELTDIELRYRGGPRRHEIEALSLRLLGPSPAEVLSLSASAGIDATAPFALAGTLRASADALGAVELALGGRLAELTLHGTIAGGGAFAALKADLAATLAPFDPAFLREARLASDGIDLSAWVEGAPRTLLDLRLVASAAQDKPVTGTLTASNRLAGPIGADRIPVTGLETAFSFDPQTRRGVLSPLRAELSRKGRVNGRGTIALLADAGVSSDWQLQVDALDLKALDARLVDTRLAGRINLAVTPKTQRFDIALDQKDMRLEVVGARTGPQLVLERLLARAGTAAGASEVTGRARVGLDAQQAFEASLQLRAFDPARFLAEVPGAGIQPPPLPPMLVNARVNASGRLQPAWQVQVDAAIAPSRVGVALPSPTGPAPRTLPLQGHVRGLFSSEQVEQADILLAVGRNRLRVFGAAGAADSALEASFDGAELALLLPGLGGQLNLAARISGRPDRPAGTFDLKGARLSWDGSTVGQLGARGEFSLAAVPARLVAEIEALKLTTAGLTLARVGARLDGSPEQHTLSLAARAPDIDARVRLEGGVSPAPAAAALPAPAPPKPQGAAAARASRSTTAVRASAPPQAKPAEPAASAAADWRRRLPWRGRLVELHNLGRYPVRLSGPAALEISPTRVWLAPARLDVVEGRMQIDALQWEPGRIDTRGSLSAFPVGGLIDVLAAPEVVNGTAPATAAPAFDSTLRIGGQWALASTPQLNGTVTLRRESGDVALRAKPPFPLGLTRVDLDLRFTNDRLQAQATGDGIAFGQVTGALALEPSPGLSLDSPMTLRLDVAARTLKPFARFVGTAVDLDGGVALTVEGTGTPRKPELNGTLRGDRLRLDAPQVGVAFRDGRLNARLAQGLLEVISLEASAGQGRFTAKGSLPLRPGTRTDAPPLTWQADRLALLSRPDRRMVVDGNGTLTVQDRQLLLAGRVVAREGYIEFGQPSRPRLGEDVVIVGRAPVKPAVGGAGPLALRLDLDFGNAFRVVGSGLDTMLAGQLALTSTDDGGLAARGTMRTVRGTFSAFGQRLEIARGQLVFNGPLDNPGLDILALRRMPQVEAGVEITGTARALRVSTTSNPPMAQGEQLSWLVLGRSLDNASQADAALIAGIAASMLGGNGNVPVTRRIADAFGLDDVGLRGSSVIGGQVLTVGKRVSDRIYIAYEQAVTTAANLLRIEFVLHRFVSLRAEAGAVSGFGIFYTRSLR